MAIRTPEAISSQAKENGIRIGKRGNRLVHIDHHREAVVSLKSLPDICTEDFVVSGSNLWAVYASEAEGLSLKSVRYRYSEGSPKRDSEREHIEYTVLFFEGQALTRGSFTIQNKIQKRTENVLVPFGAGFVFNSDRTRIFISKIKDEGSAYEIALGDFVPSYLNMFSGRILNLHVPKPSIRVDNVVVDFSVLFKPQAALQSVIDAYKHSVEESHFHELSPAQLASIARKEFGVDV